MKVLNLNCHHGEQPLLKDFLHRVLDAGTYDVLLLQEVNEKVLALLRHSSYQLIRSFNPEIGYDSDLCIVYRQKYRLANKGFRSFASMHRDPVRGFKHPGFALLWIDIEIDKKILRVASIHLHSGINYRVRATELRLAKNLLLRDNPRRLILAGDFNTGLSYERTRMARRLAPELIWMTRGLGSTLDSRYSENVAHLPNRIAAFLGIFNIAIRLRTDHVFVDRKTATSSAVRCSILSDRVSDHSPIEFTIDLVTEAP